MRNCPVWSSARAITHWSYFAGTSADRDGDVGDPRVDSRAMRVRMFELRLIAAAVLLLWLVAAAVVVVGYRPGGPFDGVVGLTTLLPVAVALLGLLWPPAERGDRAFAAVAWVGLAAVLLLVPSIAGLVRQVVARGPQTLLPSWEAVYPWFLALLATALFGGLGVARRVLGVTALRRRRLELGLIVAVAAAALSGSVFAAAAVANDLALRQVATSSSRFGPTVATTDPLSCSDPRVGIGDSARVVLTVWGDVDGRPIGTVDLHGERDGADTDWTADVATSAAVGQFGLIRRDGTTWTRVPGEPWTRSETDKAAAGLTAGGTRFPPVARPALDQEVFDSTLSPAYREAAEDRGLEFVEGARARHCRIALDGTTFLAAFPEAGWMAANEDLHRWRGALDYWVFLDGQVGRMEATVNGEAASLGREGLLANLDAILTATDRGAPVTIARPTE
jgi:hypothetical protein